MVLELFVLAFVLIFIFVIIFAVKIRRMNDRLYSFYHRIGKAQIDFYEAFKAGFDIRPKEDVSEQQGKKPELKPRNDKQDPTSPRNDLSDPEPQSQPDQLQDKEDEHPAEHDDLDFLSRRKDLDF